MLYRFRSTGGFHRLSRFFACSFLIFEFSRPLFAQGTAFTYQGRLTDGGAPANGSYDFRFTLYGTNADGGALAGPITNKAVAVSNGLFTTTLDFGNPFAGANCWLEIAVATHGGGKSITLAPRQAVTPAPYAITAGNVVPGGLPSGIYTNAVVFNNVVNQFNGDGSGLTGLSFNSLSAPAQAQITNLVHNLTVGGVAVATNDGRVLVFSNPKNKFTGAVSNTNGTPLSALGDAEGTHTPAYNPNGVQYLWVDPYHDNAAAPTYGCAFGDRAGSGSSGNNNTIIGYAAMELNTNGNANSVVGFASLETGGSYNVCMGEDTLQDNAGSYNTVIGSDSGQYATNCSFNIVLGEHSMSAGNGHYGDWNIFIGNNCGNPNAGVGGNNNIYLANNVMAVSAKDNYTMRLGNVQTNTFIAGLIHGNGGGLTNLTFFLGKNAACPTPSKNGGWFWNSNNALYWVTTSHTNCLSGP